MPQTLAVVTLNKKSNIPADAVQNSFAFAHTPVLDGDGFDNIAAQLTAFYNTVPGGGDTAVAAFLSPALSTATNMVTIQAYDITGHLDGTPHGGPTFETHFTLGTVAANPLPAECAVTLSFKGPYGTAVEFGTGATRPRARHRGRIFLGPMGTVSSFTDATTKEVTVSQSCRINVAAAAGNLMGDVDFTWSAWSRARAALDEVVGGWVDNAFDTQRRRGIQASVREMFGDQE